LAALKLPAGFKALFPLTDDRTNFDIALSSYRGRIYPGQGIVLYFSVDVLPTAKVQLPVLGPLALHFLRSDLRSILDSLSDQSNFARALSFTNTTFFDPRTFHMFATTAFGAYPGSTEMNGEELFRMESSVLDSVWSKSK